VLVNALAAGLLFEAGRRLGTRITGLAASLAWTFWPVSVRALYYVDSLLGESLAIPAVIVTVWALALETRRGALGAGCAFGIGVLARPHLAPALPLFLLGVLLLRRRDGEAIKRALLVTLAASMVVAPWAARNAEAFRAFIPLSSQSGLGLWAGWAAGVSGTWDDTPSDKALVAALVKERPGILSGTEPEKSALYLEAGLQSLRQRGLLGGIRWACWKLWLYVRPWETFTGLHLGLLVCTLLAPLGLRQATRSLAGIFSVAVWVGIGATAVTTFYLGRYRVVSTPAVVLMAAFGLERLISAWRAKRAPPGSSPELA